MIDNMKKSLLILALSWCSFFMLNSATAQSNNYGAYNIYPQGSSRAVGLGGALTAVGDDASAILFNPAGLAFSHSTISLDGSNNPVENTELGTAFTNNSTFQFAAAAFRFGDWALGLGMSTPYLFKGETFDSTGINKFEFEVAVTSGDLILARKLNKEFSAGFGLHYEIAKEIFSESNFSGTVSQHDEEATAFYPSFGVNYRTDRYGFGATYSLKRTIDFDEGANDEINGRTFFRDIEVPAKLRLGVFYKPSKKLLLSVDLDKIDAPRNSILVGTGISNDPFDVSGQETPLLEEDVSILHGGIEYRFVESRSTDVIFRVGMYKEPARVAVTQFGFSDTVSFDSRMHLTFGIEARIGPIVIGVAFDNADDFQNSSQALSISFGAI